MHFTSFHKRVFILFLTLGGASSLVLAAAPGGGGSPPAAASLDAPAPSAASNASMQTPASAEPSYMSYRYEGDRYRDPFIPLTGAGSDTGNDHAPQITSMILKGIIQDDRGRVAILSSGVSSYILRAGRLYDGRNRPAKGISGVIKAQSVVLVGPDRVVKEFTLDKSAF